MFTYEGMPRNSLIGSLRGIEELFGVGTYGNFAQQLSAWIEEVLEERIISYDITRDEAGAPDCQVFDIQVAAECESSFSARRQRCHSCAMDVSD